MSATNLAKRWPAGTIYSPVLPAKDKDDLHLTGIFVGGSFTLPMINHLIGSGQFDEIDGYYYYHTIRSYFKDAKVPWVEPKKDTDFPRKIFAADFLVLELNEQRVVEPSHLKKFLAEALKNLPDPAKPLQPFSRDLYCFLERNTRLIFLRGKANSIPERSTAGLDGIGDASAWSVGKEATLNLKISRIAGEEVRLQADVSAFLEKDLNRQKVEIFANGSKTGEWIFTGENNRALRDIPVPENLIAENVTISLKFITDKPTSPQELGISDDWRKLGFKIKEIRFPQAGKRLDDKEWITFPRNAKIVFKPGKMESIPEGSMPGFETDAAYTWTTGKEAELNLLLPDTAGSEMTLQAKVAAFLGKVLEAQVVEIYINGEKGGEWIFTAENNEGLRDIKMPVDLVKKDRHISIEFIIARPTSPKDLGLSDDSRKLGFRISHIEFLEKKVH